MITITYSVACKKLASTIKHVLDSREPIIISKKEGKVVMISLDDWNAWQETFALLANTHMAQKLEQGIEEFNNNRNIIRKLQEDLRAFEQ